MDIVDYWIFGLNKRGEGKDLTLPEPIPTLRGKVAKEFLKEIEKPLSRRHIETFREAERVYKSIKRRR